MYFSLGFLNVYSTYIWPKTDQVYLFLAEKTILRTMVGDDHVSRVLTAVESATPCHDTQCDAVQYSAMRRGGVVHAAGVSYACVRERGEAGQHRSSASITTTREGGAHKKRTLWSATVANSRYRAKKKNTALSRGRKQCALGRTETPPHGCAAHSIESRRTGRQCRRNNKPTNQSTNPLEGSGTLVLECSVDPGGCRDL